MQSFSTAKILIIVLELSGTIYDCHCCDLGSDHAGCSYNVTGIKHVLFSLGSG